MKIWFEKQKKNLKKWQRRYKGVKLLQKFFKLLIGLANKGITVWQLYENFLKDRLAERNN